MADAAFPVCLKESDPRLHSFPVYIFDIDGTLLDSAADICGAIQQVLSEHLSEPLPHDYLKSFIGYHLNDCFTEVLPDFSPAQLEQLVQNYRTLYPQRKHAGTARYPNVIETLRQLRGRKGTATTKSTPTTRAMLEQFELLPYFDHVQGTDGFPCKPAPDVLLRAMEGLDAKPDECLFVGDSAADMEAGHRARIKTCGVRYGYGNIEHISKWQPDYWIDDIRELL